MSVILLWVALVAAALAYANGANDVSKGIATLVGSGVTDYKRAIAWGALWTGLGGLLGAVFGGAMLATFGRGLLTTGISPTLIAGLAALGGAAAWVLLATRAKLPVSTTHAIVGSLVGVATLAYGSGAIEWHAMGMKVFLPLLLTPLLSLTLTSLILRLSGRGQSRREQSRREQSGHGQSEPSRDDQPQGSRALIPAKRTILNARATLDLDDRVLGSTSAASVELSRPAVFKLQLHHLHWLTSGATSLARGMNDAPKIVGLALAASILGSASGSEGDLPHGALYAIVTLAMVAGSLLAGRRVTRSLAEGVTPMNDREGFTANLVTAALVTTGALHGLPMSTTHVASGGIFGAGAQRGTLKARSLFHILLAWVVTLPAAGMLGAGLYLLANLIFPSAIL